MIQIAALILSILFPIVLAKIDAEHFNRKQYFQDKRSRVLLRGLVFIIFGLTNPLYIIGSAFMFWSLFDQSLNLMRDNTSFWSLGSIEKEDAKSDKWGRKYPLVYKSSKVLCLIVGIAIFIVTL